MKIISSFKDYYDSVSHQYLDTLIKYVRDQKRIDLSQKKRLFKCVDRYTVLVQQKSYLAKTCFLGFCGEIYPLLVVRWCETNHGVNKDLQIGLYSLEDCLEFFKASGLVLKESRWKWHGINLGFNSTTLARHFENSEAKNLLKDAFREFNVPAFLLSQESSQIILTTNPFLKALSFAKIKDPFTAHQDLSTYIPAYLSQPQNPLIEISDEDRIHKHGYNKWSFRKPPQR